MTVATFTQPNFTTQLGNSYKGNIDGGMSVFARIAGAFAPHEQSTPNMTVRVDAGYVFTGSVLTEVAAQSSAAMVAPTTNPRIDRIVVDAVTGVVSVVTGVQGASPVAPAIPAGKVPVAQVLLQTASGVITNAMLTDERIPSALWTPRLIGDFVTVSLTPGASETIDVVHGLGSDDLIVDVTGRGVSGQDPTAWGVFVAVGGSNYSEWKQGAGAYSPTSATPPSTGTVRFLAKNVSGLSTQTISIFYQIRRRL